MNAKQGRPRRGSLLRRLLTFLLIATPPALAAGALAGWFVYADIDDTLVEKFEGRRWDFPSKIYADGYAMYPGLDVSKPAFYERLARLMERRENLELLIRAIESAADAKDAQQAKGKSDR